MLVDYCYFLPMPVFANASYIRIVARLTKIVAVIGMMPSGS